MEKRGQELSIGTLVLIVLGVIVLVLLVLGFTMGWENLFSKVNIYQGNDLSSVVTACNVAASSQSTSSYCEFKTARLQDNGKTVKKQINCEFKPVRDDLGSNELSCGDSVINQYCVKVKTDGTAEVVDDKKVVMVGLRSPCPKDYKEASEISS